MKSEYSRKVRSTNSVTHLYVVKVLLTGPEGTNEEQGICLFLNSLIMTAAKPYATGSSQFSHRNHGCMSLVGIVKPV